MLRVIERDEQRLLLTCQDFIVQATWCSPVTCEGSLFTCKCSNDESCSAFPNGTFFGSCPCPVDETTKILYIASGIFICITIVLVFFRVMYLHRKKLQAVQMAVAVTNPDAEVVAIPTDNPAVVTNAPSVSDNPTLVLNPALVNDNPTVAAIPVAVVLKKNKTGPW